MDPHAHLARLIRHDDLSQADARALFDAIMDGRLEPPLLAAILAALATKGETVDEIVGAAEAMRARVTPVRVPAGRVAIDTCGTGGDGRPTFNVSTAVAIVAAAAGATVAKHGNRSHARPSGSAEGIAALGINVDADVPTLERCLAECGVAFLFAPKLHPAMKQAAPVRQALHVRTLFNLVGPLTNPAGVERQLVGVNRPEYVERVLDALRRLGSRRALVVHGVEGLCDLSISGPTIVGRLDEGRIAFEHIGPDAIGAAAACLETLFVRSAQESAALIERILAGEPGPPREMVVFNAAAALWVAGVARDWADGAARARAVLDSGAARGVLERWRMVSRGRAAGAEPKV
jgi:anthranilate phosphoribosyltransferase